MVHFFLIGLILLATAVPAQIAPATPGQQRAAARRAQREAQRTDAPYKDGHLAVASQPPRRGSAGGPTRVAHGEPRFGRNGAPRVAKPFLPGLRRPKNEPKP